MTTPARPWSLTDDLDAVFRQAETLWPLLRGKRIFLTGGTGFIGCWLLETLRHADIQLSLDLHVSILSRDVEGFARKAPHLASYPAFHLIEGDVTGFATPPGTFTHIVHAATDASADLNERDPLRMFDVVVEGTCRILDLAREKNPDRFLFLSSGAVYGPQPSHVERVPDDWQGGPDCTNPRHAYAEAKRTAEMLCAIHGKQFGLNVVTARIFTLLGPYMPLGAHFAAGNFILDAMNGRPVQVNGNGLPRRSYLYAGDLANWLWHMLLRGETGRSYNAGSEADISIGELAACVSRVLGDGNHAILGAAEQGWNAGRYVPDTARAREELGLFPTVSLDEAIRRTALWNGWQACP